MAARSPKSGPLTQQHAVAELWRRGILSWILRPEQKKLLTLLEQAPTDLATFNVCRRLGKSTTCVTYCIGEAIRRKQQIRYATAFLSDLEQFILPIFEWVLSTCPKDMRPAWKASKKEFLFPGGSVIKLVGLDKNPDGLRGNAIDILVVDEAAFVANLDYLYRSIIVPATMNRKFKLIFPSTPPESPEHFWAAELVQKAKERKTYVEMTIDDISDLPAAERQRLLDEVGGEQSATAQREFFCKIIVDTNRSICPTFNADEHVRPVAAEHVNWQLFGDTGGVKDKTVFLEAGYDHSTDRVLFRDELVFGPGTPTSVIAAAVKSKWPGHKSLVLDASGQLLIDYSSAGLPATLPAKDDFAAGLLLLSTTFHNDKASIDPRCSLLVRTLQGGLLTKNRSDFERSEALGHADAVAAAIYALRGVDRVMDLRPKPTRENTFRTEKDPPHIAHLKGLAHARR